MTDDQQHIYLSTGCYHGGLGHDWCQSNTGSNGQKKPASCKWCDAPCVCECHVASPEPPPADGTPPEETPPGGDPEPDPEPGDGSGEVQVDG
jgi:hypothetical protein